MHDGSSATLYPHSDEALKAVHSKYDQPAAVYTVPPSPSQHPWDKAASVQAPGASHCLQLSPDERMQHTAGDKAWCMKNAGVQCTGDSENIIITAQTSSIFSSSSSLSLELLVGPASGTHVDPVVERSTQPSSTALSASSRQAAPLGTHGSVQATLMASEECTWLEPLNAQDDPPQFDPALRPQNGVPDKQRCCGAIPGSLPVVILGEAACLHAEGLHDGQRFAAVGDVPQVKESLESSHQDSLLVESSQEESRICTTSPVMGSLASEGSGRRTDRYCKQITCMAPCNNNNNAYACQPCI